jgi:hypothetical protein
MNTFLKQSISYIFVALLALTPAAFAFAVASYEVTTYSATNVCKSGATLNGYVNPFFTTDTVRWFEWGTSQNYLPNQTNQSRNGSNTEYFRQDIVSLTPNTTYYFRVAANNSKGTGRGEVLSFRTEGSAACAGSSNTGSLSGNTSGGSDTNTYVSQSVITKRATDIINTGARLNAVALPLGQAQTYGWFEWGGTPDLGNTSVRRYLGSTQSLPWSEVVSGLTPGTTYFFKPVAENQDGRFEGVLFSFRTTGTAPAISPVVSSVSNQTASAIKPTLPKTVSKPAVITTIKEQKIIEVVVTPNTDTVTPKDRVKETIQFENTTGATLKEVVVRAVIPCDAEYVPSGGDVKNSDWLQTGKMLTHRVGDVKPKEKVNLLLSMDIVADVADKTPIETIAVVNWEDKTSSSYTQSVGRSVILVDKNKTTKESAVAGAAKNTFSIFPASLKDWGVAIGFLFLLFAVYMVFLVMHRDKFPDDGGEESADAFQAVPAVHPALGQSISPAEHSNDPFITDKSTQRNTIITPVVPIKKTITEKGAPPENLPI